MGSMCSSGGENANNSMHHQSPLPVDHPPTTSTAPVANNISIALDPPQPAHDDNKDDPHWVKSEGASPDATLRDQDSGDEGSRRKSVPVLNARDVMESSSNSSIGHDGSLVIPTHQRKRGSSVSIVVAPEDHLKSPKCKSPPQRSFEAAMVQMNPLQLPSDAAGGGDDDDDNKNDINDGFRGGHENHNDDDNHNNNDSPLDTPPESRRQSHSSNKSPSPLRVGDDDESNQIDILNIRPPVAAVARGDHHDENDNNSRDEEQQVMLAENGETSLSISTNIDSLVAHKNVHEARVVREASGEEGVFRRGDSLVLPTGRKRGSSVSLVMAPEDHLKSPKCKSPPQRSFEGATVEMEALDLNTDQKPAEEGTS